MTNYGDVTSPRWVGGVNAPASGEEGRRPVKPPEGEMERVYSRGYEEAFAARPLGDRGVWIAGGVRAVAEWARKEALKEAANVAAVVVRARGTAREVADAVYLLRED